MDDDIVDDDGEKKSDDSQRGKVTSEDCGGSIGTRSTVGDGSE